MGTAAIVVAAAGAVYGIYTVLSAEEGAILKASIATDKRPVVFILCKLLVLLAIVQACNEPPETAAPTPTPVPDTTWRIAIARDRLENHITSVAARKPPKSQDPGLEAEIWLHCSPPSERATGGPDRIRAILQAGIPLRTYYVLDADPWSDVRANFDEEPSKNYTLTLSTALANRGSIIDARDFVIKLMNAKSVVVEFQTNSDGRHIAEFETAGVVEKVSELAETCAGGSVEDLLRKLY